VTVVADVVDPDGRRVVLDDGGWTHILDEHGEMARSPRWRARDRNQAPASLARSTALPRTILAARVRPESLAAGRRRLQHATGAHRDRVRQPQGSFRMDAMT
jgi:hypothetical protein